MKTVAVVVPFHKDTLTPEERISLRHLLFYLGKYDKYLVLPEGKDVEAIAQGELKGLTVKRFNRRFFASDLGYNRLLIEKKFYRAFCDYEYILVYQLDSLVFADQLLDWCRQGYDYTGAPWLSEVAQREGVWGLAYDCVGNGGFSLRRVQAFLKVLDIYQSPLRVAKRNLFALIKRIFPAFNTENSLSSRRFLTKRDGFSVSGHEDIFWSFDAVRYYPQFKIAPVSLALTFSCEAGPRVCFERNKRVLPFGCHAWVKYGRDFWQPYLLK